MLLEREVLYERLAKISIDTSKKTPEEIITKIIEWVENDENLLSRS